LKPIVLQLLDILEGIHSKNLIHRDISPDNIFLIGNGEVRLIDFGAARTYQGATHFTVQKKDVLAPLEQFSRNGNQGPWTDIYTLSATIYLLLTGKLPAKVYDRLNKKVPLTPLKRLAPNTPDAVARAVERGLAIRPEDRFSSIRDFRAALEVKPVQPMQYWLYGMRGCYAGRRKPLPADKRLRMGRGAGNDIFIPDEINSVSRNQCELYVAADNVLYVRDLGSRNGTYLNGKRIGREWVPVSHGSTLSLGLEAFELVQLKAEGR
jgi:serine/threonine protein kinase